MFKFFLSENGFDALNCIVQSVIAISAWITLILTRRKVSSTTKVKLKIQRKFKPGRRNGKSIVEIEIDIVNLGMAPIYIEEWGITLHKIFWRNKREVLLAPQFEEIKLEPGQPYRAFFDYPSGLIEDQAPARNDKVRIYVKYCLNEVYYSKKEEYYDFRDEYERTKKSVDFNNNEIQVAKITDRIEKLENS